MNKTRLDDQGQTLLIVVFAMSLGLLVIVHTASRALGSVARTTQTNYYQKATSAAEGGAEIYLAKPFADLPTLAGSCPVSQLSLIDVVPSTFPASCIENMNGSTGEARAFIGAEEYPVQSEKESLKIGSQPGETIHINLDDSSFDADFIQVCWKGLGIGTYSASHYFYYYGLIGDYKVEKDLFTCNSSASWCVLPGSDIGNVTEGVENGDYTCYSINVANDSVALRIFTFPDGANYLIDAYKDVSGSAERTSFPQQGYRVVSIGEVRAGGGGSLESKKATRKRVTVEKTFPYPAGPWWDFAVTSVSGTVSP